MASRPKGFSDVSNPIRMLPKLSGLEPSSMMSPDLVVAFAVALASMKKLFPNNTYVEPKEAAEIIGNCQGDVLLIDVRSPESFAVSHIPGAVRWLDPITKETVLAAYDRLNMANRTDIVIYCLSGSGASKLANYLGQIVDDMTEMGDDPGPKPVVIAGSIAKWANEARPMVDGDGWPASRVLVNPEKESAGLVLEELQYVPSKDEAEVEEETLSKNTT